MRFPKPRGNAGIALVAVLWLVAALSLVAVGMVQSVRIEIQTAGLERTEANYGALSDAAILLAIQQLQAPQYGGPKPSQTITTAFEGQTFDVSFLALNGRIDINSASEALLTDLYHFSGGLPIEQARQLALATINLRQSLNKSGSKRNLASLEDLLQVPQFTYDLYAKIKPSVTSDLVGGSGKVNAAAAPVDVLKILGGGGLRDVNTFKPEFVDTNVARSFDVRTTSILSDGTFLTTVWIIFLGQDPVSRLPWRLLDKRRFVTTSSNSQN